MATISEIRSRGTDLLVTQTEMPEPIRAPQSLRRRLARFDSPAYNLHQDSHLFRYIVALCGEAGAGSVKRELLYPRLQQMLESTHFSDLDRLYGNPLALPRLSAELYTVDPMNEALTQTQWRDVRIKDSQYRARCLTWMRAIIEGPTPRGMALAGEAALGIECEVIERYKWIENQASDDPITISDLGQTNSRSEFVILPRAPSITQEQRRRLIHLIDKLRPINTLPTVTVTEPTRAPITLAAVASSSDNFNVKRTVTARPDVDWPDVDLIEGYWLEVDVPKEAPTFAWMDRQESVTYISIADATASSEHVGDFNKTQQQIFGHLSNVPDRFYFFTVDSSYAKSFAPVMMHSKWVNR